MLKLNLFFSFVIQLQEILRERICHQQLPVRPEGVEAQHKWGHIVIIIVINMNTFSREMFKNINQPPSSFIGLLFSLMWSLNTF